jgi:hypothetical protein
MESALRYIESVEQEDAMKLKLRALTLIALGLVFTCGTALGQNLLPKKIWTLTIRVNVPNAQVYVDNVLIAGITTKVAGGDHGIKVHADGYADFNGTVKVTANTTYPVRLDPLGYPLTLRVPAPNARIFVDGRDVTGSVPSVGPGAHTIQVTAPGYMDYVTTINVSGPVSMEIPLQQGWILTINVNVPNAAISVDNVPIAGNATAVQGGTHTLSVHADGYADFVGSVNVNGAMTYSVRLNPLGVALSIRVSTPGASVFVDGNDVTGTVPQVAKGQHAIRVAAPGFLDYNASVNVTGPMAIDVVLQPAGFALTVNANVMNATVAVNNVVKGATPYQETLPPGTYSVRVSAEGFADYAVTVALNKPMTVNALLKSQASYVSFIIPAGARDPEVRGNDPQAAVRIYIDGALVNRNREMEQIPVKPGRHAVRAAIGAFSVQMPDLNVEPGMSYTIELSLTLQVVRSTPVAQ